MMRRTNNRKPNKGFFDNLYSDSFDSPRANPKHAAHQVNGETQQTQSDIITEVQMNKRA